jgi:hypothetical protein
MAVGVDFHVHFEVLERFLASYALNLGSLLLDFPTSGCSGPGEVSVLAVDRVGQLGEAHRLEKTRFLELHHKRPVWIDQDAGDDLYEELSVAVEVAREPPRIAAE